MNKLSFKGEYKNGEKNGKGKEYFQNKKIYLRGNIEMEKNGTEKDMILLAI